MSRTDHWAGALVIVLLVFFRKNGSFAIDLPVFACEDMGNLCSGIGSYACRERHRTESCGSGRKTFLQRLTLSTCRLRCHLEPLCASYLWNASNGQCFFCGVELDDTLSTTTFEIPVKVSGNLPVPVEYGIHHGLLRSFVVSNVDYISKGYITPVVDAFKRRETLIHPSAESIRVEFQGPFCVLIPHEKRRSDKERGAKRGKGVVLIIVIFVFLICTILLCQLQPVRRRWLFLKHRARAWLRV